MEILNKYKDEIPSVSVYIGRGSPLGNPIKITDQVPREQAIKEYEPWLVKKLLERDDKVEEAFRKLKSSSKLVCFCKPKACHGDVIVKYWNYFQRFESYEEALSNLEKDRNMGYPNLDIINYKEWLILKLINRDPLVLNALRDNEHPENLVPECFDHIPEAPLLAKSFYEEILNHGDFDKGLIEFAKKYTGKNFFEPKNEQIDHINIYSTSASKLGRLLSNFAHTPFKHPVFGEFQSVEGFWYYVKTGFKHEQLRSLHGIQAKRVGKEFPEVWTAAFEDFIRQAISCKIYQNEEITNMVIDSTLPFTHYFYFGEKENPKIYPLPEHEWQVRHVELLRSHLKGRECGKLIIAGSRDFSDYAFLEKAYRENKLNASEIVSGLARGADSLGVRLAHNLLIPLKTFEANWDAEGKRAGILRNIQMGDYADTLLSFWNGESKGTKHMIEYMGSLKKKRFLYNVITK